MIFFTSFLSSLVLLLLNREQTKKGSANAKILAHFSDSRQKIARRAAWDDDDDKRGSIFCLNHALYPHHIHNLCGRVLFCAIRPLQQNDFYKEIEIVGSSTRNLLRRRPDSLEFSCLFCMCKVQRYHSHSLFNRTLFNCSSFSALRP